MTQRRVESVRLFNVFAESVKFDIFFGKLHIFQLFCDALYDAADLKDQSWLDLLDLTLFVDWMGKADMDKELRLLKLRCFSALEDKLVRQDNLEFLKNQWAQLLLVFGKY